MKFKGVAYRGSTIIFGINYFKLTNSYGILFSTIYIIKIYIIKIYVESIDITLKGFTPFLNL
jgi:hypothetical protein